MVYIPEENRVKPFAQVHVHGGTPGGVHLARVLRIQDLEEAERRDLYIEPREYEEREIPRQVNPLHQLLDHGGPDPDALATGDDVDPVFALLTELATPGGDGDLPASDAEESLLDAMTCVDDGDGTVFESDNPYLILQAIRQARDMIVSEAVRQYGEKERGAETFLVWALALDPLADLTPSTEKEALTGRWARQWWDSMVREFRQLVKMDVWSLRVLPRGEKAIPSRFVFKIKANSDHSISSLKSRLVAQATKRRWGQHVSFADSYSSVMRQSSFRTILAEAARRGWTLYHIDIRNAFVASRLPEGQRVWIRLPKHFRTYDKESGEELYGFLHKSLYGLITASKNFQLHLATILKDIGLQQCETDPCLWILDTPEHKLICGTLVDDIVIGTDKSSTYEWFASKMELKLELSRGGELDWFSGQRVTQTPEFIRIDQQKYAEDLLETFGMTECRGRSVPLDSGTEIDKGQMADVDDHCPDRTTKFMSVVGGLNWLQVSTRPDLCHVVSRLASVMKSPSRYHMDKAMDVLRYVRQTKEIGITYTKGDTSMKAYADASFAPLKSSRKSIGGHVLMRSGGAVSWRSKTLPEMATSTFHAELMALYHCAADGLNNAQLLEELLSKVEYPLELMEDNQPVLAFVKQDKKTSTAAKFIDIKYYWLRQMVKAGKVALTYCPTDQMTADVLTKFLGKTEHWRCLVVMMNLSTVEVDKALGVHH
eukprot:GFYU01002563.1.p1 GENE.GFYU01002563.1~~GFYU01002563.1.p1  ORF type:complete len:713 (+),score=139.65 GFYU01002563.1:1590-3728(+)